MDIKDSKKFFWTAFILSALFFIASALMVMLNYEICLDKAVNMYRMTPETFNKAVVYSMSLWKILIFQFTLIPAIVLTLMDRKKHCPKED